MPEQHELTGSPTPIDIAPGGYSLQAPGLVGRVTEMSAQESATRSDSGVLEERLLTALRTANIHNVKVFEIEVSEDQVAETAEDATRSGVAMPTTRDGEPAIVFKMPGLGENVGYAVLYSDETGTSRWLFPEEGGQAVAEPTRGGDGDVTFHIPRYSPPPPTAPEEATDGATRGPISKLGRRLVRVVAWATDEIIGDGALTVAQRWERANRPYGLHWVLPGRVDTGRPVSGGDWDSLRQGRILLLLHGTFSNAQAGFDGLIRSEQMETLASHYDKRVLAFNHPSLYHSPADNVRTLLETLPQGLDLDLDVITHSRGGLVGRELTERLDQLNPHGFDVTVRRAILVAGPNQGTILADGDNWISLVDRYTNFLTNLPDNVYTLTFEGILAALKLLAHGALAGLPGLSCLVPGGDYLNRLNTSPPHQTEYYALAANFTPTDPGLLNRFYKKTRDTVIDVIFGAPNDGVVPTEGSYAAGDESTGFPIPTERRRVYQLEDQVNHSTYFTNELIRQQIVKWLQS